MKKWTQIATDQELEKTVDALSKNGIEAQVVENGRDAKRAVLELIPQGAEVFTVTSETTDAISLSKEINQSNKFDSVRNKLIHMDRQTQRQEINRLGAAPQYVVGSVHAVTQDGKVLIASNSGSQLPSYAYGAGNVLWVVGAQKVVRDIDEGMRRIYEHSLPLESKRARKAYGITSGVSKLLIINKEKIPGRIKMILVKEKLGF